MADAAEFYTRANELRGELARMAETLPGTLDLTEEVRLYKIAGRVEMLRHSLIWRAEEIGRQALSAYDSRDFVVSAILTRALMETAAALVYLHSLVQKGINKGVSASLGEKLLRFFVGSKAWEDVGNPIHINDMLGEVEKVIPGFETKFYARYSEYAHPNWAGTFGAYGIIEKERLQVNYARGGRDIDTHRGSVLGGLSASVGLALGYYEMLGGLVQPFVSAVKTYHDAEAAKKAV